MSFVSDQDIKDYGIKLIDGLQKVTFKGINFEIALNTEIKSEYLFVCLSGAKPIGKELPYFNRWKWSNVFHSNILAISDYTLNRSDDLQIGWYLNDNSFDTFNVLAEFIFLVAKELGYCERNIYLYGSSAGGFGVLKCAEVLKKSKCIAINPQTDISKYYFTYYEKIINILGGIPRDKEMVNFVGSQTCIVQNVQDIFHLKKHYLPIKENFKDLNYYEYSHENGHGAEPKEIIPYILLNMADANSFLFYNDDYIDFNQLEIANLSKENKIDDNGINFLPQGRSDIQPIYLNFPLDWNVDPLNDKNWKFQLNMWRFMDSTYKFFSLDKNIERIKPIRKVLKDWYSFHFILNKKNDFLSEDMAIGGRAMRLAYYLSIDREYIQSDSDYKEMLNSILKQHILLLLDYNNIAYSNHTLTDIHGLMALSKFTTGFIRKQIENFIDYIFPKLVEMQFSKDAYHKENSPEYHFFAIKCFSALKRSNWFKKYGLNDLLDKANLNKNNFYLPDGRILPFGDSTSNQKRNITETIYHLTEPEVIHQAGYLIYRDNHNTNLLDDASYFAIMGGLRSRFHKQNDDLSFIWFEGEDIIRDFGKYAYKKSKYRNYAISSVSHNSLLFNKTNIYRGNTIEANQFFDSAISNVEHGDGLLKVDCLVKYSSGNIPEINQGLEHSRRFFYIAKNSLIITDKVNLPVEVEQFFHFSPQWKIYHYNDHQLTLISEETNRKLEFKGDENITLEIFCGTDQPLQGWSCIGYASVVPSLSLKLTWGKGVTQVTNKFHLTNSTIEN